MRRAARRSRRHLGASAVAMVLGLWPGPARASEVRALSRTVGEGYTVRLPGPNGALVGRRRLAQYVNLGVYRLLPPKRPGELVRHPDDGQLQVVTSMRLRHDFGTFAREARDDAARLIANLDGRQIDLLYGYLEGRGLAKWIDVRLGRQFEMSGLDFYAFDGGFVRAHTPAHLAFEVFGGFQVNGEAVFGYPTFVPDGTQGTSTDRGVNPMVGAAVALDRIHFADARFAYRRTWAPASLNATTNDIDGIGVGTVVNQHFITASMALRLADHRVSPFVAGRYNLGTSRLDDLSGGVTWAITKIHSLRAQYLRTIPAFDLNSIFNVFALEPFQDIRVAYEVRPNHRWTLIARFQGRVFESSQTLGGLQAADVVGFGAGGGAAAVFRIRRFSMRIDGYGLGGEGGMRAGGNLSTRTHVLWDRIAIDGRVFAMAYRDEIDASRRGHSVAVQAGVNAHLTHGVTLNVVADETFSPYMRHAFRAFAMFTVDWAFRVGARS